MNFLKTNKIFLIIILITSVMLITMPDINNKQGYFYIAYLSVLIYVYEYVYMAIKGYR